MIYLEVTSSVTKREGVESLDPASYGWFLSVFETKQVPLGLTDGWTDGLIDERTDVNSCKNAWSRLVLKNVTPFSSWVLFIRLIVFLICLIGILVSS